MQQYDESTPDGDQEEEYWFPYHYVARFPPELFRQHFVDTWGINYVSTIEFMLERIKAGGFDSLIDIGCGDGRLTREIILNTRIRDVRGVDYSRRAITLAKAMNQDLPDAPFSRADITAGHSLGQYDAAVLMEVFEHIPLQETDSFMQAVRKLLKPGGRLFLTVPHANKPVEYKHYQHFTMASITGHLAPYFDIDEVVPFERSFGRTVLNKLLCNRFFVLNSGRALGLLYAWHQQRLFRCRSERECQRIYVEATASKGSG